MEISGLTSLLKLRISIRELILIPKQIPFLESNLIPLPEQIAIPRSVQIPKPTPSPEAALESTPELAPDLPRNWLQQDIV